VLTAFPPCWHINPELARTDATDVYNKIFQSLISEETDIFSATDLVSLIIDKCSSLFHPGPKEEDPTIDYFETFTIAIARLVGISIKR
jgi:hypothetical protein